MLRLASLLLALCLPLSAQNYSVTPRGTGCGGADLVGSLEDIGNGSKKLIVDCTGLFPQEFGFVCWGVTPIAVPLPGGCTIWTDFIYGHTFQADALGTWHMEHGWPNSIYAQFYIQVASYRVVNNAIELKTTDAAHFVHLN